MTSIQHHHLTRRMALRSLRSLRENKRGPARRMALRSLRSLRVKKSPSSPSHGSAFSALSACQENSVVRTEPARTARARTSPRV